MTAATVLVVTSDDDYTADLVVHALTAQGTPVIRLNPGTGVHMETELTAGRWHGTVGDGRRAVDIDSLVSVFWRWPDPPPGHPAIQAETDRRWAAREDLLALYGVLHTLPVRWVNHPVNADAAEDKPRQLVVATQCGLTVPHTLITTSGRNVHRWAAGRPLVYKAFRADGADDCAMVVADRIPGVLPDELLAAHTFQETVHGASIRLTRIGSRQFAAQITGTSEVDWRPTQGDLTYQPVDVPPDITQSISAYMAVFGLEYGAFDFIAGEARWVFLECNPTGQYGFVEVKTKMPITKALVDRLRTPLVSHCAAARALAE